MGRLALTAFITAALSIAMLLPGKAAEYPLPKQAMWTARDFRFTSGEVLPELKIGYTTIGEPTGEPVLLLHGSGASASYFLTTQYAGELFGPDQPLDARKYYLIIPDALGSGRTSKPSDGLKTRFPRYNYVDMVHAQHRLLTEGLGIRHLRLVSGNSMGGMEAWLYAQIYPDYMDGVVPLASTPGKMSGRNWITRRLLIETIKRDPEYRDGDYTQPPPSMKIAFAWFGLTTNGGTQAFASQVKDAASGDKIVTTALNAANRGDANDLIYQYEAAADYDPLATIEKITAPVLAINSQDDERNPPELGVMEEAARRNSNIRHVLIPSSPQTRGHSTTGNAKLWKDELAKFLLNLPRRSLP